jgi:uncharacterized protein (DUF4415 family)
MIVKKDSYPRLPDHLPPLTDEDGEVRELTAEDFKHFRPMKEMFPEIVESFERMRGERGPQIAPVKQRVGLRLDADVLARFRETGRGWQARINDILKQHLQNQQLNDAEGHKK